MAGKHRSSTRTKSLCTQVQEPLSVQKILALGFTLLCFMLLMGFVIYDFADVCFKFMIPKKSYHAEMQKINFTGELNIHIATVPVQTDLDFRIIKLTQ